MKTQNLEFSIVIPTYNRPERLERCLSSIANLDYSQDSFEVVVVDDGSQQSLLPIVQQFEKKIAIRFIRQDNAGPASARNKGAAAAQGKYLVFTDDDCQVDSQWLTAIAQGFAHSPQALVGGYTINALPENAYSTASQLLIDYIYSYYNIQPEQATFFASNNFAMSRELYHEVGGFDTDFPLAAGEDREFCDRWRYHGYPMWYAPAAKIHHAHWLTMRSFWRQHFNYGRGAYHFHQIRGDRTETGIKVEPLTFYWQLLTFPFSQSTQHPPIVLGGSLFLSQVANALGFFREKFSDKSLTKVYS
ncbi:glycosyltransferase [Oscillatoria sp. CS-180]|uniref:glycosyltransferase family 2 protein n=1 Tax=Oscillatoria sp. CS-180 TaxID=3021720 RepID=UPI00232D7C50|nr:glycosyltransferase [Oscillatoria sp. CS-180]MDB9527134.1 glycosyltransferase [Oscillatoria sp. CS-180]